MHRPNTRATTDHEDLHAPGRRVMRAALARSARTAGAGPANPTARVDVLASDPAILAELLDRIAAVAREPGVLEAAAKFTGGASPSPTASLHARLRVIATRCKRASLRITFEGVDGATTSPLAPATHDVEREAAASAATAPMPLAGDWISELTPPVTLEAAPAPDPAMQVAAAESGDWLPADSMLPGAPTLEGPDTLDAGADIEPQPDYAQAAFTLQSSDALDQFGAGPLPPRHFPETRSNVSSSSTRADEAPIGPARAGSLHLRTVEHPSVSGSSMFEVVRLAPLLEMPERHPVRREDMTADRPTVGTVLRNVATRGQHDLRAAGAAAWSLATAAAAALAAESRRQVSRWQEALRSQHGRRPAQGAATPAWLSQPLWRVRRQSVVPTSVGLGAFFSVLVVGTIFTARPDPASTLDHVASTTAVSPLAQTTRPGAAASLSGSATGVAATDSRAGEPSAARSGTIAAATATSAPAAAPRPRSADAQAAGTAVPPPAAAARGRRGGPMFVGTLDIISTPPGATVSIDNRAVGTTPLTVREVRAGTRAVRVEHDGFARWSRAVLVPADQRARVKAVLSPARDVAPPRGDEQ